MNDKEAREIVLQIFYDKRAEEFIPINEENFGRQIAILEVYRICIQLNEKNLIQFKAQWADNKIYTAWGKITASGSDLIEQGAADSEHSTIRIAEDTKSIFIDESRIAELHGIRSQSFDLSKLIQLCNELNTCYKNDCFFAVSMLARTILDHVPPIFKCKTFDEVANNSQGKSLKKSMLNLQNSLRNIADASLHLPIREKETLPNRTQINFANDFDVLLSEIVRLLK